MTTEELSVGDELYCECRYKDHNAFCRCIAEVTTLRHPATHATSLKIVLNLERKKEGRNLDPIAPGRDCQIGIGIVAEENFYIL